MDGKVTTAIVVNVDDILTDEQNIGGLRTEGDRNSIWDIISRRTGRQGH